MAVQFGSGLAVQSQNLFPNTSSFIQGGDFVNFTLQFVYNTTQTNFSFVDATGCKSLPQGDLVVKALLTLPLVFNLVSNVSHNSQRVVTDVSNCGGKQPKLTVTSVSQGKSPPTATYGVDINITSSDVSWTVEIDFVAKVSQLVLPDAHLNVSADVTDKTSISRGFVIANYMTPKPTIPRFIIVGTSIPQTPGLDLTTSEEVRFYVSFNLPKVTSDVKLSVILPLFRNSTPMKFVSGSVLSISSGVTGLNAQVGLRATFSTSEDVAKLFGSIQNLAEMNLKGISSTIQNVSNSVVTVQYAGIVESIKWRFASQSHGNISCTLEYTTPRGKQLLHAPVARLRLDEPLLVHSFSIVDSQVHYEGKSLVRFSFFIKNPEYATVSASNVSAHIRISRGDMTILHTLVRMCNVSSMLSCYNITEPDLVTRMDGGVSVTLQMLDRGMGVFGNLTAQVNHSVAAGSLLHNHLSLSYQRARWSPFNKTEPLAVSIQPVEYLGLQVTNSSVLGGAGNYEFTIGENVQIHFKVKFPVSTNRQFILVIGDQDVKVLNGLVKTAGENIHTQGVTLQGKELNITTGGIQGVASAFATPVAYGHFGTVVNTGNSSRPEAGSITFEAEAQVLNSSRNRNGHVIGIRLQAYFEGVPHPQERSLSFKVVEPDLVAKVEAVPVKGVKSDSVVEYTVRLHHSGASTTHAYGILLEVAVPHAYTTLQDASLSPGKGVRIVTGTQTPSGSSRYKHDKTKVLVYEASQLLLNERIVFHYKVKTINGLPSGIYISSPVYLAYTTLPSRFGSHVGRKTVAETSQAKILTFRPAPYVDVVFKAPSGSFDAGDRVENNLTVANTAAGSSPPSALDLKIQITLKGLDWNASKVFVQCDKGSVSLIAAAEVVRVSVNTLAAGEETFCNITSFIINHVSPKQLIFQRAVVEYYGLPSAKRPADYASYTEIVHANIFVAPVNATVFMDSSAMNLTAGQEVDFRLRMGIPECVTPLQVVISMPTFLHVPRRKKRDLKQLPLGEFGISWKRG